MRTRTVFNPRPRPHPFDVPGASTSVSQSADASVGVNPFTSPVPPLVFDRTGQIRNIGATVSAIKAGLESLIGQRGDQANRAVTFKDLLDFGVITLDSLNAGGSTPLAVVPAYFTPADPSGSSVGDPGMMLGTNMAFTPGVNGAFLVNASGTCTSGSPIGSIAVITVRAGSDAPPVHGDTPKGAIIGVPVPVTVAVSSAAMNWAFTGIGLGYTPLAPVWLDLALSIDSGTALLGSINVTTLGI